MTDLLGNELRENDYVFYAARIGGKGGMALVRVGRIVSIIDDKMQVKAAGWFGWTKTAKERWQPFDRLADLNKDSLVVKFPAEYIPDELRALLNV